MKYSSRVGCSEIVRFCSFNQQIVLNKQKTRYIAKKLRLRALQNDAAL